MTLPVLIAATLLSGSGPQSTVPLPPAAPAAPQSAPAPAIPDGRASIPLPTTTDAPADEPQADITVIGSKSVPGDPLSAINAKSFAVTESIDNAVGAPVARSYIRSVPRPIRSGIHNFFNNLREPIVFFNFLLQHKFGKAAETLGRFAINSTIGVAGFGDVAKTKPFRLPRRQNSFADTLGFYGVKPGPFFYIPVLGPTTLRDLAGGFVDALAFPMPVKILSKPTVRIPVSAIRAVDHRAYIDDRIRMLRNTPENNYDAAREFYLKRRQAEIDRLRGKPVELDPVLDSNALPPAVPK